MQVYNISGRLPVVDSHIRALLFPFSHVFIQDRLTLPCGMEAGDILHQWKYTLPRYVIEWRDNVPQKKPKQRLIFTVLRENDFNNVLKYPQKYYSILTSPSVRLPSGFHHFLLPNFKQRRILDAAVPISRENFVVEIPNVLMSMSAPRNVQYNCIL